jgi:hypothetical protein
MCLSYPGERLAHSQNHMEHRAGSRRLIRYLEALPLSMHAVNRMRFSFCAVHDFFRVVPCDSVAIDIKDE